MKEEKTINKLEEHEVLGSVKEVLNHGILVTIIDSSETDTILQKNSDVVFTYDESEMNTFIEKGIKKGSTIKCKTPELAIATMSLPPQMPNVDILEIIN